MFYIQKRSRRRAWAAGALAVAATACGAYVTSVQEPPRAGVVVTRQPGLQSVSLGRPSPDAALTASAEGAPTKPMPRAAALLPNPAPVHPAAAATDDPQALAVYRGMDAKLRPGAPAPEWASITTLAALVAKAEPNTTVSQTACAEEFCRVDLHTASGMDQGALVDALTAPLAAQGSALMFHYPQDRSNQVVVYVLKPDAPSTEAATARTGVGP